MSKPASLALEVVQNSTDVTDIYLENPPGTKWDLSEIVEATFTVKDRPGGTEIFQKTLDDGIEIVSAAGGQIRVTIVEADFADVTFPTYGSSLNYVFDLDMTDGDGNKYVPVRGRFTILREV